MDWAGTRESGGDRFSALELFEAGGEAGNFPGPSILVDNALCHAAHDLRFSGLQGGACRGAVSRCQRFLDLANGGTDLALAVLVHGGTACRLANALFGRSMAGHGCTLRWDRRA